MTTHRSVTASTMKYGSMAELLDAARNRRTMMMVMTLPNTPRSTATRRRIVLAQTICFVNGKEDMSKLTGDVGSMVMFGTALVMTDEILLLFSMITGNKLCCNTYPASVSSSKIVLENLIKGTVGFAVS